MDSAMERALGQVDSSGAMFSPFNFCNIYGRVLSPLKRVRMITDQQEPWEVNKNSFKIDVEKKSSKLQVLFIVLLEANAAA